VETKQIQVKTLALSIAAVAFVEAGLAFSKAAFNPLLTLGLARLLELGLIVRIVRCDEGSVTSIGLDRARWLPGLRRGLLWSAGFGALSGIVFAVLFMAGINPLSMIRTSLPKNSANLLLFFLVGGIVAPVAEEVFFRGILFAAAYEIEKNLIVPITIHCLGNLAIFSLSLIG
jgi:hypothetical protein